MTKIFNKKEKTFFRRKLRNSLTKSEVILWKFLKGKQNGFKFRRQCSIGKYIVDFYCPELKLVIEVDGSTHYEEEVFNKDLIKDDYLKKLNLIIKRYNAENIFNSLDDVLSDIYNTCEELKNNLTTPAPPS
jgi:very-short-patch-repair endonuclease